MHLISKWTDVFGLFFWNWQDLILRLQHKTWSTPTILQLVEVVKFYFEKSVHGGFGLQCVHIALWGDRQVGHWRSRQVLAITQNWTGSWELSASVWRLMPRRSFRQPCETKQVGYHSLNCKNISLQSNNGGMCRRPKPRDLTWWRRAGPGAGWGCAEGKPSQTLWSCWAPSCPGDPWRRHK